MVLMLGVVLKLGVVLTPGSRCNARAVRHACVPPSAQDHAGGMAFALHRVDLLIEREKLVGQFNSFVLRVTYVVDCFARAAADVGFGIGVRRGRQPDPYSISRGAGGFHRQHAAGAQSGLADGHRT